MNRIALLAGLFAALAPGVADADPIYANFTTATSGTLNGVSFTISGYDTSNVTPYFYSADLSGSNYSAAPGSATQQSVSYASDSGFTITFASAISGLFLADIYFRGPYSDVANPTYTFDSGFTIASGDSSATVSGDSLVASPSSYNSGLLDFSGPITELTMTTNLPTVSVQQAFTLAVNPSAVPEPSSLAMCGLAGLIGSAYAWRRRKRAAIA